MTPRRAAKKDGNQTEIVEELRSYRYDVDIVHSLSNLYDLVVSGEIEREYQNTTLMPTSACRVELKIPGKTLKKSQIKYRDKQNHADNYVVAKCTGDVLRWFNNEWDMKHNHRPICKLCQERER